MPEYLYPGVYVEEVDTGNKPIEGVSTSTVGFLGIAERGPTTATYITSFTDFRRTFGSYYTDANGNLAYLAYAVEGFFLNGGLRCWIARVTPLDGAHAGAGAATVATATSGGMIKISAAGPGVSGSQIAFLISNSSLNPANLFKLSIFYWANLADANAAIAAYDPKLPLKPAPTQTEVFDNLSANPSSSNYYVGAVGSGSNLVVVSAAAAGRPANINKPVLLGGGKDATVKLAIEDFTGNNNDPANPVGMMALSAIDDISLLCCPDESAAPPNAVAGLLQSTCENRKDRFAILQSVAQPGAPSAVTPSVNSEYTAFYYPWLNILDPTTNIPTLIPPCGHIAGIYARSDNDENVAKDPANEQILGIDSLQVPIDNQTQSLLNPIGVNCLRYFKGRGNLVWGGRTTSSDPDWQYINVRRLFIFIEKSIQQGTQWVVFEPNDAPTWARVVRSVSDFLTGLWMQNMLMGATKDQAFFVRCDNTTMTQTDIESGRLIVLVGIAPVYPAEFVIFRIGQWSGGSSVSEG